MQIEDMLLTKAEIPVFENGYFMLPIHKTLVDKRTKVPAGIAQEVFPQAVTGWYDDLMRHVEALPDGEERSWFKQAYLKRRAKPSTMAKRVGWYAHAGLSENGLARQLMLDMKCTCIGFCPGIDDRAISVDYPFVKMSAAKIRSYALNCQRSERGVFGIVRTYEPHNVDRYPEGLMLRNWGLLYLN